MKSRKEERSETATAPRKTIFTESLDQPDHKLLSAVHYAIISGNVKIIRIFVDEGAEQAMLPIDTSG